MISFFGRSFVKLNYGFTLVEVLVSLVLISILVPPFMRIFYYSYHIREMSQDKLIAGVEAQNAIERLKTHSYLSMFQLNGNDKIWISDKYYMKYTVTPYKTNINGEKQLDIVIGSNSEAGYASYIVPYENTEPSVLTVREPKYFEIYINIEFSEFSILYQDDKEAKIINYTDEMTLVNCLNLNVYKNQSIYDFPVKIVINNNSMLFCSVTINDYMSTSNGMMLIYNNKEFLLGKNAMEEGTESLSINYLKPDEKTYSLVHGIVDIYSIKDDTSPISRRQSIIRGYH